jgi:hypothetical protein
LETMFQTRIREKSLLYLSGGHTLTHLTDGWSKTLASSVD